MQQINKFSTAPQYWTCSVSIPDTSGIHGLCKSAPNFFLLISSFAPSCWYLFVTCLQAQATHKYHKYQMKREIEIRYLFYRSFDSVESYSPLRGLWGTHRRSALEDHEGHPSWSIFQLLFLLPLVDSFPCGGRIEPVQTSQGTPQALGCSLATPSRLGPKNPRVTNANHEIDRYAQVFKGGLLSNLNFTQPTRWICKFESITH